MVDWKAWMRVMPRVGKMAEMLVWLTVGQWDNWWELKKVVSLVRLRELTSVE